MINKEILSQNHEICLQLLDKFLEVCEKNKIEYYLAFGSCLGTIRHKGFIPWDINIDVLMTVDEYKRLDLAMQKEELGRMKWCCPQGSARMFPLLMRDDSWDYETKPNIDVSIYCNAPNNNFLRSVLRILSYLNIKMYKLKNTQVKRTFPFNFLKWIASLFSNEMYKGFVNRISNLYANKKTKYQMVVLPSVWENREQINTEWYGDEPYYGEFEGRKVRLLSNWHDYLTMRYGDYMKPKVWEDKGEYKHITK